MKQEQFSLYLSQIYGKDDRVHKLNYFFKFKINDEFFGCLFFFFRFIKQFPFCTYHLNTHPNRIQFVLATRWLQLKILKRKT